MSELLSSPPPPRDPPPKAAALPPAGHELALAWLRANPLPAAVLGALLVTLGLFYGAIPIFYVPGRHTYITFARWLWEAWNPESHYEHGPLVPFIILFLIWNALPKLRGVPPAPAGAGLVPFAFGVALCLLAVRALQPRFGWAGLPFMLLGGVVYAAGWRWARTLLFPILCVFFLIPVPGIDQATVKLQIMATQMANAVCNAIGLKMVAVGTTLRAVDESFQFQVIGDCSGINSLMAITLMTAVFAHLTQDRLWKKLLLFAASGPVAIVGNIARLTAIMIVAKCFGQTVAGGWFHEISAYLISFPLAFGTLCLVHKILNWGQRPSRPHDGDNGPRRTGPTDEEAALPLVNRPLAMPGGGETPTYDY